LKSKVLLIGSSGNLGSEIVKSKKFKNLDCPKKNRLNLLQKKSINKFLNKKYNLIINCAALARMKECEKNPNKAIKVNIIGTLNLINEIIEYEIKYKKKIRLIHISTDGVYPSINGGYSENDILMPYNIYGWTKLCSELIVKRLKNYVIIRTRFFNKKKIRFDTAAIDIFTSMLEVQNLVTEIKDISSKKFIGVINVGTKKKSDYENFKKYKADIRPCKRKDILKDIDFKIAKDASMNLNLLKRIKGKNG
jgi:dTDP-4-dehydrorhamnose reductase